VFVRSVVLAGVATVLGALLGLAAPVHLHSVDRTGTPIPCGDALRPRYTVAQEQDQLNLDQHTTGGPMFLVSNYADQCAAVVSDRQSLAIPAAAAGAVVALIALVPMLRRRTSPHGPIPQLPPVTEATFPCRSNLSPSQSQR
jgi:hypothetical protein